MFLLNQPERRRLHVTFLTSFLWPFQAGGSVGLAVPGVLLSCTGTSALAWSFPDWVWRDYGSALSAWGGMGFWETKPCSPWEGIEKRFGTEILALFVCTPPGKGKKIYILWSIDKLITFDRSMSRCGLDLLPGICSLKGCRKFLKMMIIKIRPGMVTRSHRTVT